MSSHKKKNVHVPIQSRFGKSGLGGSLALVTKVPDLCINSTSKFVLAIDVTNRNKL